MTVKIQLPSNKKEAQFVLDLLEKLNISFFPTEEEDISKEQKALLRVRIKDMEENPNDVISWEDIQKRDKLQPI
jgi:putative addiction module component (TIGR02574 family)